MWIFYFFQSTGSVRDGSIGSGLISPPIDTFRAGSVRDGSIGGGFIEVVPNDGLDIIYKTKTPIHE